MNEWQVLGDARSLMDVRDWSSMTRIGRRSTAAPVSASLVASNLYAGKQVADRS